MRLICSVLLLAAALPAAAATAYRWSDAAGGVHFGDRPVAGATALRLPEAAPRLYTVAKVLDGDTVELAGGERVRLLGVNAPEIAHGDRAGEDGGEAAARFLGDWLTGKGVTLAPEVESTDRYGRLLAHLATADGTSVEERLLREGLAYAVPHPPNTARAERFAALDAEARAARKGLWALPRYRIEPMARAGDYRNTFRRLQGRVTAVAERGGRVELAFGDDFTAYLEAKGRAAFDRAGKGPAALTGHTVVIRGWVQRRSARPVMTLYHPAQIEEIR